MVSRLGQEISFELFQDAGTGDWRVQQRVVGDGQCTSLCYVANIGGEPTG